jgi:transposase
MNARQQKAKAIVVSGNITRGPGCFFVPGSTGSRYRVVLEGLFPSCTCADFETTHRDCKHMLAAREWEEQVRTFARPDVPVDPASIPVPPRPTYPRDWPNYNLAQTREKDHFLTLLGELCDGITEPERDRSKGGRPRHSLRDVVFTAAYKTYSGFSGRRFMSDVREAKDAGFVSRAVSYNALFEYLEDDTLTPILHELIRVSSLPLKSVDVNFAVDSSGFTTSRFVRWFDHKYGVMREKADWVKAHVMTGVLTNVITAVEVLDRHAADGPQLPKLVATTAKNFRVEEVSADAAYNGNPNHEAVDRVGGVLFAAFRRTTTGQVGGLFEKAFHYFNLHRDEFLRHYHRRSNIESTFSMVKAKFRDHVRSKTDAAMVNEVLCKFLCHNLCCLVSAIYELGIDPTFWGERPADDCSILKFPGVR